MTYATFNGWTIINPPALPGFKGIVLRMNDTVAVNALAVYRQGSAAAVARRGLVGGGDRDAAAAAQPDGGLAGVARLATG
jgi:hypothetical protein